MNLDIKQKRPLMWIRNVILFGASALLIAACNDDEGETIEPVDVAYVSLYQGSPDAPDLDIVVDSRQINTYPFDYADYTGYLRFYTGDRNLKFGPYDANNIVADTTVEFEAGGSYSVFTAGNYNSLKVLTLEDDGQSPGEGNAMIRFINLSPDAPALTLMTDEEGDPLVDETSFMEASDFMEISADNYDLEITAPGGSNIELDVPDITFQEGWYYTVIARGYETPPAGNDNVLSAEVLVN